MMIFAAGHAWGGNIFELCVFPAGGWALGESRGELWRPAAMPIQASSLFGRLLRSAALPPAENVRLCTLRAAISPFGVLCSSRQGAWMRRWLRVQPYTRRPNSVYA